MSDFFTEFSAETERLPNSDFSHFPTRNDFSGKVQAVEEKAFPTIPNFPTRNHDVSVSDENSNVIDVADLGLAPQKSARARGDTHVERGKVGNSMISTEEGGKTPPLSGEKWEKWENIADAFEERAAVLEFDEGLTRAEAEALAAAETGYVRPPPPAPPARTDWRTRMHVSGPGVTITAPAILVPVAEYNAHLDGMIAAAGEGTTEASVLWQKKRKGNVVERGGERIYVMGRA